MSRMFALIHEDMELKHWDGLRRGEADSLEWLYVRYFKLLYNYGRKISSDEKALEDGIHDLFVDLWKFRENLSETTSVRFYLYRSLRRRLARNRTQVNQNVNEVSFSGNSDLLVAPEEDFIIEREGQDTRVHQLKRLLRDLSPRQYEAMILRFYDELSFQEIGSILNVNEQSARNLVQRGLAQLKQYSKFLMALLLFLG